MPKGCLVISMVTPNPNTCQVAKENVSRIVRYGHITHMDLKKISSQGVREGCFILSQNTSLKAYEDDLSSCSRSKYINKESHG